tara:strand:+ start:988 stop:1500 length:513 start_codon:yes stop_codon:yes gene_type:complete
MIVTTKLFKYDNGISFYKNWNKFVDKKQVLDWWEDFSSFNIHNYEYYIVGGFINKEKTKDLDVVITGQINKELNYILSLARLIGIKYKLFVDIRYKSNVDSYDFFHIKNYKKLDIFKNNKLIKTWDWGGEHIGDNLYRKDYTENDIKNHDILKKNITNKNKYIKIKDFVK